jgi:hypothetical protein
VPVLVLPVAEDLNELFQNRSMTPMTPLRELSRVMEVTVDLALVFVVGVLGTKDGRTN